MSSNSHVLSLVLSQQIRLPTQHVQDSVNHQFLYFLFPLLHGFHFLLHVLTPAICSTTGFRYLSCVESLCVQMCAWTSRFLRNLKGPIPEDPLNPGNECQGLGRWVVSGPSWSLLPPQSAIPANALMWEGISLGWVGGVGGGWRGGGAFGVGVATKCHGGRGSCSVATVWFPAKHFPLYFQGTKNKCCYKVQNFHSEHFSETNYSQRSILNTPVTSLEL